MKVTVNKSCIVRPATPTTKCVLPLTEFDQVSGLLPYVPGIVFYRPQGSWHADVFTTLTNSLSKALVYFYPVAGRLRRLQGGRLEVDCNDEGVLFTEVESREDMKVLGDFTQASEFHHHLIPRVDNSAAVEDLPLLLVQLTEFRCGGFSLGFALSHAVFDGHSWVHFLWEWARLARGKPIMAPPYLDRKIFRAGEPPVSTTVHHGGDQNPHFTPPPLLIGETNCEKQRKKATSTAMLHISNSQIETLRKAANNKIPPEKPKFSRYETLAAHIWRCACRARRHVRNQPTRLGVCVDIRNRMNLPRNFFGNAIIDVIAESFSGEVTIKPLSFAVSKIRKAINSVTDDYVNSSIDYLKSLEDLSPIEEFYGNSSGNGPFYGNPNISVTSWLSLPMDGFDFGWGPEVFLSPGGFDSDGDTLIMPGRGGDGAVVFICLQEEFMEDFNKFFYEGIHNEDTVISKMEDMVIQESGLCT